MGRLTDQPTLSEANHGSKHPSPKLECIHSGFMNLGCSHGQVAMLSACSERRRMGVLSECSRALHQCRQIVMLVRFMPRNVHV